MMIIIGIIVSILVFSVIVLLHEYGHFKSARIFGVKVEEFGLGIPPKARKLFTDKHGTDYTLNWLPL
jgi:regulator of sigma E protease